ncbi:cytochrome C oxidase subunit IV family protein [Gordonia sp. SL306]|uniref:cytochrome C oxidase subunit IV family protein n=1 Tax=Gordonia sp. SL306 TaxID=2995145 RepID=UPI00226F78C1|nr:cytochrome C oxidase subunit IV family protein [Gordonia sp. SL306]WAC55593.1 cytochrome C oxidase subunit IV family protein [Gordonia sp. SL306]
MTDLTDSPTRATSARTVTWVWLILVAITIGSWWLAPAHYTAGLQPSVVITTAVLVITFIKSRLIIGYFMEVRTAPRWLRMATDSWLAVLFIAVFAIYLV